MASGAKVKKRIRDRCPPLPKWAPRGHAGHAGSTTAALRRGRASGFDLYAPTQYDTVKLSVSPAGSVYVISSVPCPVAGAV